MASITISLGAASTFLFFEGAPKHGVEQIRASAMEMEAEAFIGAECKRSMVGPQVDVRKTLSHAFKGLFRAGGGEPCRYAMVWSNPYAVSQGAWL